MTQAKLLTTFSLDDAPANEVFPADINNDGRMEYLFLQSPGIFQSKIFNPGSKFWDQPYDSSGRTRRTDYCLTAMDGDGRIIWQYGQPKPYVDVIECFSHVPDQMVWCEDLNDDGQTEVALIHLNKLVVLEGATGKVLKQAPLESDNFGIVRAFSTQKGKRLLVKNTEQGYPPHWYGDPALIFDADLNLLARIPKTVGSGHSPRAVDLNGDGDDELLIGYEAFDADGNPLWRLEELEAEHYNPDHHVDQIQVGRLGDNPEPRIVYAGSFMAYLATLEGKLIWAVELGHPQHVLIGNFVAGGSHAQLAFHNQLIDNTIFFLRAENARFYNVLNPQVFWPENPGRTVRAHSAEGILIYPQGCQDGSDAVITRDWGWPRVYDLGGREPFVLPPPKPEGQAVATCPFRSSQADEEFLRDGLEPGCAVMSRESYGIRVVDADSDGQAEILVHNLRRAWLFKPPLPEPGAPNTHDLLQPVTGQGLYRM